MIGYNVEKIEELMLTLVNNYKRIGEKMSEGWPALSSTLEKEWIGPDEVSYETELANNICNLYDSCAQTITSMEMLIYSIGVNWQQFQATNVLNGTTAEGFKPTIQCQEPTESIDIRAIVKAGNPVFTASTNMGLANGTTSGTTIKTQFDTYIGDVYTNVQGLYANLENAVSLAFLGSELNVKVNEYLQKIGTALAQLATCHKSIYEALDKLIANYSTHESTQATDVSGISTDSINFNGENLK